MPINTKHYDLTAFSFGDTYSASADRRRFSIIDNEMWFLAEQIGDGIIDGWNITVKDGETVTVAPGYGVIDGFFSVTYGELDYIVPDNRRMYLYMRKKPDIVAETGPFSDIETVVYSDSLSPSTPSQPSEVENLYNSVTIEWDANPEPDISYYEIHRHLVTHGHSSSSSSSPYTYDYIADSEETTYTDEDIEDGCIYEYKIKAVDYNGHKSGFSSHRAIAVPYDLRIPSDPTEIDVLSGNNSLQVYWGASNFLANSYRLTIQPITLDGIPDGSAASVNVSNETFYYIFEGLNNGQLYEISVSAVSENNVTSPGVSGRGTPFYSGGASELKSITVSDFSIDSSYRIGLNLSWELQDDEYALDPDYYLVTIYRDGEDGVASVYTATSNQIIRYTARIGVTEIARDIEEETKYTIKIQTVSGDVQSNGFIIRFRTQRFRPPLPVTELEITSIYNVSERSIVATWQNSQSTFAYNSLTVKNIPLDTPDEYLEEETEYLELDRNYGQSTHYSVKLSEIENFYRYEFFLTVHDIYGNTSEVTAGSAVVSRTFESTTVGGVEFINSGERPPTPTELFGISGNDQATLYWNAADTDFVDGYKLYRADFNSSYQPSDFSLITETTKEVRKFTDYTVDNGSRYVYFVTTVDVFGNESPNPSDDYIYYAMTYVSPRSHSNLTKAPAISVSSDGYNAVIEWETDSDNGHDGYQIFRSENNKYSFEVVGSVGPLETSFVDEDALLKDGNYYYMIRKFRNEAELYASRSKLAPAGSLAIGLVSRFGSQITITDLRYDIKLLADPMRDKVAEILSKPSHLFFGVNDDRRIRLQDNLVITEWTTDDYQIYTTEYSMVGTGSYIAYIDGVQSPYGTIVDRDEQTITFETPIFDFAANAALPEDEQVDPPEIMVIFTDVGEITGKLSLKNVEDIFASKVTKGKIPYEQLPEINHYGRYKEKCIPTKSSMTIITPQLYSGDTPTGVTFYDVIKTPDGAIMAATPAGVMFTANGGNNLTTVFASTLGATRLIYSDYLEMYFAAVGDHVRVSIDGVLWVKPSGMDSVAFVRDIVSDEQGTVYASCDTGVYKIEPLDYTKLFWTQLNIFDANDTNAYGLAYKNNTLYVGGRSGIYYTSNDGTSWHKLTGEEINVPIHSIHFYEDYIFGVSNNKVWRLKPDDTTFQSIGDFASPCRKGVYFGGDFFVTTDQGLYRSSSESDVLEDSEVKWEQAFQNLNRNGLVPATHALKLIDGRMWLGQDERLYSVTTQGRVYTHADIVGTCPTIFVNDVERSIGVFYSSSNRIMFDVRQNANDVMSIVNSYTNFDIKNGGWADLKYDAEILINVNGTDIIGPPVTKLIDGRFWNFPPEPWVPPTDTKTIATAVGGITTPFFNGRNSSFNKAMASLKRIVQQSDAIQTLDYLGEVKTVPAADVSNLFKELDVFKSLIHPELRGLIKYPAITGVVNYNGFTALYDVVNGKLEITNGVNKYSVVTISIKGVSLINNGELTHYEIEDIFEKWNSGLSTSMALIQQTNIIRSGIYQQRINKDELKDGHFVYQAEHYGACDDWYDRFKSTIDYEKKIEQLPPTQGKGVFESIGFSIDYAADVLYVESLGEVWVCGHGGIIAIDKDSFESRKIVGAPFYFYNMVLSEGIVYSLAEDGLYKINTSSGIVSKDLNIDLLPDSKSVYVNANTTYLSTKSGVYSKRPFEESWTKVFDLLDAEIRSSPRLTFAVGKNPNDTANSIVYYSFGGVIWNRSNNFTDIIVNGVTQRYNSVYYATNSGLVHEDLSRLFSNSDFDGPLITAVDLEEDVDSSEIHINDVDADDDRAIAVTDTGKWYSMSGGSVEDSGQSRLSTIHKVKVVDGKYWLFSDNLIEIENVDRLIPLATGKALI